MLTIYHNPRCSKSREALNLIEESGSMVQVVEYLNTPLSKKELQQIVEKLGIKPEDLVRKNEAIYKEQFKGKNFTDDEWLDILESNPKLIERPIVVKEKQAVIARPPEKVKELLQ